MCLVCTSSSKKRAPGEPARRPVTKMRFWLLPHQCLRDIRPQCEDEHQFSWCHHTRWYILQFRGQCVLEGLRQPNTFCRGHNHIDGIVVLNRSILIEITNYLVWIGFPINMSAVHQTGPGTFNTWLYFNNLGANCFDIPIRNFFRWCTSFRRINRTQPLQQNQFHFSLILYFSGIQHNTTRRSRGTVNRQTKDILIPKQLIAFIDFAQIELRNTEEIAVAIPLGSIDNIIKPTEGSTAG